MIDPSRIVGSDDMGMIESLVVVVTLILKACLSLLHARDHGSKRNLRFREPPETLENDI